MIFNLFIDKAPQVARVGAARPISALLTTSLGLVLIVHFTLSGTITPSYNSV